MPKLNCTHWSKERANQWALLQRVLTSQKRGIRHPINTYTDASATCGIVMRRGLGRTKHLQVEHVWAHEAVRTKNVSVNKIPRAQNHADMFTHHWVYDDGMKHMTMLGHWPVEDGVQ